MQRLQQVHVCADPHAVAAAALAYIVRLADDSRKPGAALHHLCIAGGTTPRTLYSLLPAAIDLRNVDLWFSDERMVPPDHADSNFAMVQQAYLQRALHPPRVVHRIAGEHGATAAADAMNAAAASMPGGLTFDLALLGVGADGHTASLFPGDAAFVNANPAGAAFTPARDGARVSASFERLAAARQVIFVVTGASKASMLAALPGTDLPAARLAAALGPRVLWLLDADAAAQL